MDHPTLIVAYAESAAGWRWLLRDAAGEAVGSPHAFATALAAAAAGVAVMETTFDVVAVQPLDAAAADPGADHGAAS